MSEWDMDEKKEEKKNFKLSVAHTMQGKYEPKSEGIIALCTLINSILLQLFNGIFLWR